MVARIIDGTRIGREIREEVRSEVLELRAKGIQPGLAAILVGNRPASQTYVRNKIKACRDLGIYSQEIRLPEETTTDELLGHIEELNKNVALDGILVQLPLPPQIDEAAILLAVEPEKDVDGLHAVNAGKLVLGKPSFGARGSRSKEVMRSWWGGVTWWENRWPFCCCKNMPP
jgi:methylenetetrahydrofolate dehydrogenase (NADP+) / methenyltetrahydrofolate cyclohydrolase